MKQRILAEAHGATPAARSILTVDDPLDAMAFVPSAPACAAAAPQASARTAGVLTAPRARVPAPASGARTAHIPAPRARAHEAVRD